MENQSDDAAGLLSALGEGGIGAVYLTGRADDLPGKLLGIRLAFLDLVLDGTGTEPSFDQLAAIVETCIGAENGPWVAIAWTSRPDDAAALSAYLTEKVGMAAPLAVGKIDKADVRSDGRWDLPKILKLAHEEVARLPPLELINEWEQGVHNAASHVTFALMAPPPTAEPTDGAGSAGTWTAPASRALGLLLRETATRELLEATEKALEPDMPLDKAGVEILGQARRALYEGLHPLLIDAVDTLPDDGGEHADAAIGGVIQASNGKVGDQEAARMNSAVLLGPPTRGVVAGNVYELSDAMFELLHEQGERQELLDYLNREIVRAPAAEEASRNKHQEVIEASFPILVELTPECDQLREPPPSVRFLAGLAVPEAYVKRLSDKPRLWRVGPVSVRRGEDSWVGRLTFAARQPLTASRSRVAAMSPWLRLRREPTTDLRGWAAAQSARVGYLRFDP